MLVLVLYEQFATILSEQGAAFSRNLREVFSRTKDVLERPEVVAGGDATEAYIANELRGWSSNLEGRAQLAVQSFSMALYVYLD